MRPKRRSFLARSAVLASGVLLPLPSAAQAEGVVRELSGEVLLNGFPMTVNNALRVGHTVRTGRDGNIWFTLGTDAYFLRPESELRLQSLDARDTLVDLLRLVTGALGATFSRGARRSVMAQTATIGIRGTGIYVETSREETYACTCFGATLVSNTAGTMMESIPISTDRHVARRITRAGVAPAPLERHTSEEIVRLERLAGRPSPF